MTTHIDGLKANLERWTLILGVLQITVDCVVGFVPPSAVEWFRGIVMVHLEFTANGVLMVVFGFLICADQNVGKDGTVVGAQSQPTGPRREKPR